MFKNPKFKETMTVSLSVNYPSNTLCETKLNEYSKWVDFEIFHFNQFKKLLFVSFSNVTNMLKTCVKHSTLYMAYTICSTYYVLSSTKLVRLIRIKNFFCRSEVRRRYKLNQRTQIRMNQKNEKTNKELKIFLQLTIGYLIRSVRFGNFLICTVNLGDLISKQKTQ